jgi:uncharacterized membrane protein YcaP (DUF421 family)
MDTIARGAVMYLFLVVVFRLAGKRTLAEITTFDLVLIVVIAEAADNGLLPDDHSVTNSMLLITTLIVLDVGISLLQHRSAVLTRLIDGVPLVLLERGTPLFERMRKERVGIDDILHAAREHHGLARLDQIEYAILEVSGGISIIPKAKD